MATTISCGNGPLVERGLKGAISSLGKWALMGPYMEEIGLRPWDIPCGDIPGRCAPTLVGMRERTYLGELALFKDFSGILEVLVGWRSE